MRLKIFKIVAALKINEGKYILSEAIVLAGCISMYDTCAKCVFCKVLLRTF